jgi:hypothetical protein
VRPARLQDGHDFLGDCLEGVVGVRGGGKGRHADVLRQVVLKGAATEQAGGAAGAHAGLLGGEDDVRVYHLLQL